MNPFSGLPDRSAERYRRVALTAGTSALFKGASLVSVVLSVPLTIAYLGTDRFALWMTINSFSAMLVFADLGLGNGLLTAISESHGKEDAAVARRYISTSFFMLLSIGVLIFAVLVLTYHQIPWARFVGARSALVADEAGPAAAIFFASFAINLPLGIVQRIQMGFQTGYASNLWSGVGVALGFVGVVVCSYAKAGVPWLVLSISAGPTIAILLNGFQLFKAHPELRPVWREFHSPILKRLLSVGVGFMIMQAALAMAIGSDNFVIAHLLGPDDVTQYAIAMRVFTIVPTILLMVLMPLWPAYGESFARGDTAWAVRTFKRSVVVVTTVTLVAAVILTFSAPWLIAKWVGNRFHEGLWLLVGMGLWMVVNAFANVLSLFLNGINRIQVQVASAIAVGVSTLTIELWAVPKLGLPMVIWATDISFICFIIVPALLYVPRLLQRLDRGAASGSGVGSTVALATN